TPQVELIFGKRDTYRDQKIVYVKRKSGGETTVVTVPEVVLEKVTAGPLGYLDKKLPGFTTEFPAEKNVTKVTIDRGGKPYEVKKEEKDKKVTWTIEKPTDLAGRLADPHVLDNSILGKLNTLTATRFVASKATDAELRGYGLEPPSMKIVITQTKDGKASDTTYLFGKDTEDKTGIYCKQGDRDLVFVVHKLNLQTALEGELVD